jgi:putative hydrolase of HD superfamily
MQRGTDQNQFTTTLLSRQISFIKEIDRLKYIQRRTKLFNSDRRENDANIAGIWP